MMWGCRQGAWANGWAASGRGGWVSSLLLVWLQAGASGALCMSCKHSAKHVATPQGRLGPCISIPTASHPKHQLHRVAVPHALNSSLKPSFPVSHLQARPVDERLRQLGGSARLALDLVQFDPNHERAFIYALGDAVITDTRQEADKVFR